MIDTPQIIQTTALHCATLHVVVPRNEIQNVMGPGIGEVMAAIAAQGLSPSGPWFTHHLRRPTDTFDFDICIPVATPISLDGRVQPGEWPAMTVARTIYRGPYEGLADAWGELMEWLESSDHTPADDLWERYLAGPESSPDPAMWITELNRPLVV